MDDPGLVNSAHIVTPDATMTVCIPGSSKERLASTVEFVPSMLACSSTVAPSKVPIACTEIIVPRVTNDSLTPASDSLSKSVIMESDSTPGSPGAQIKLQMGVASPGRCPLRFEASSRIALKGDQRMRHDATITSLIRNAAIAISTGQSANALKFLANAERLLMPAVADSGVSFADCRDTADALGHKGRCCPIALSIVTGIDYETMARWCAEYGEWDPHDSKQGARTTHVMRKLKIKYASVPPSEYMPPSGDVDVCRIGSKLAKSGHGHGCYLVFTHKHVSAVVDGKLEDWTLDSKSAKRVQGVYKVVDVSEAVARSERL